MSTENSDVKPLPRTNELELFSALDLLHQEKFHTVLSFAAKTGIKSVDVQFPSLFRSGRVVGVSRAKDHDNFNLVVHLVTTFLIDTISSTAETVRQVFILAPPNTSLIPDIHATLRQKLSTLPPGSDQSLDEHCFSLLDRVQLLQYLDFPGLAESLQEVAQRLFESKDSPTQWILVVQGLSALLTTALRRSGNVQTCSVLSTVLHNMKQLARTHANLLVLVELDLVTRGPDGASDLAGICISAFASATGEVMCVAPAGSVGASIESEMDVAICVHNGFGQMRWGGREDKRDTSKTVTHTRIVEAVKDKLGGDFGQWCLWVR